MDRSGPISHLFKGSIHRILKTGSATYGLPRWSSNTLDHAPIQNLLRLGNHILGQYRKTTPNRFIGLADNFPGRRFCRVYRSLCCFSRRYRRSCPGFG